MAAQSYETQMDGFLGGPVMKRRVLIIALSLLCLSEQVHADVYTFDYTATVDLINVVTSDPYNGAIKLGDSITGTYTIDTSLPNEGNSLYGIYQSSNPALGFTVQIDGISGTSNPSYLPLHYSILMGLNESYYSQDIQTQSMSFGGQNAYLVQIVLQDDSETAFSNVNLNATAPNLADYDVKTFFLGLGDYGGGGTGASYIVEGTVDSIQYALAVPEPSTFVIAIIGGLGLIGYGVRVKRSR